MEEIAFAARDGARLVGELHVAPVPCGAVLIAPATGVLARFYTPFATWLAHERALSTLVFDYRGIGRSLAGKLADCEARKQDWGLLDMPAALEALAARVPGMPLYFVGHSAGGQLVGLMDNVDKLSAIAQIASSSGYLSQLAPKLRLLARFLMGVYMPLSNAVLGYSACKAIGWGEDLPRHVARQWAEWCRKPGYVANAFGTTITRHFYDAIAVPLLSVSFTDDLIATDATIDDLLRLFPHAEVTKRRLVPCEVGLRHGGHVGFFRHEAAALWPLVADFFTTQGAALREQLPPRELARGRHR